jgi:protein TonB
LEAERQRQAERRKAAEDARKARAASERPAAAKASGADLAAYGSTVASEISRRVRSSGISASGSVGVSFSIGASGGVASVSISSSGNAQLDSRVRSVVASLQFPPPPGGSFRGHVTIRVSGGD